MFTRSKGFRQHHLVFTTFLASAWRGGGSGRRMNMEVGDRGGDRSRGCDEDTNNNNRLARVFSLFVPLTVVYVDKYV